MSKHAFSIIKRNFNLKILQKNDFLIIKKWFDLPLIAEIVDNRISAAVRHGQPIENQVQSPRSKRLCVLYNHKQIR